MNYWPQNYNPCGNIVLSTLAAVVPIVVLLGLIALTKIRVHTAALLGLAAALLNAVFLFRMPADAAIASAAFGAGFGLFPISWLILNIIFIFQLTVKKGHFAVLRDSLAGLTPDPRVQLIIIAFSFGAFLEGMSGFGAPVAITAAILIQLGFKPLHASGLALLANTAPVAFGSLGIPVTTLAEVTGLDVRQLSAMIGRQVPFFSALLPFWLVAIYSGWRGIKGVWPVALTAGLAFAIPQFLISNFHGPWLVDVVSGSFSIGATIVLLRFWKPKANAATIPEGTFKRHAPKEVVRAWMPWAILTMFILCWGLPQVKQMFDNLIGPKLAMPHLHLLVRRMPPVALLGGPAEPAIFSLNLLSATGTGILFASLLAGFVMGFSIRDMLGVYGQTIWKIRYSMLTICAMLALGNVTKYSGTDATLGIALASTGKLYPFFGTLLGWLGVALTGSDTASNVLFGSLQKMTAGQLGISAILMCAANTSGGVMGKMIDAQSIVVASTATSWYGHEGAILRFVLWHSLALATLMGILVYLQAHVVPFVSLVVH